MANDEAVRGWNPWLILAGVVVLVIVAVGAFAFFGGDDEDDPATTTTSEATTTTSEATTTTEDTTTTSGITDEEASTVVWPDPDGDLRYDEALDAVEGYAEEFVGFEDPVYGELQEGDARSGEVVVRPTADGADTVVLVRQMSDDAWYVLGSTSPNIEVDEPTAGSAVDSPVLVSGRARAFEGTVQVSIHERAVVEPIGQGFVTGSGGEELGPFSGEIPREHTEARWGAIVFTAHGGEDGQVWWVAAFPVGFIGAD